MVSDDAEIGNNEYVTPHSLPDGVGQHMGSVVR